MGFIGIKAAKSDFNAVIAKTIRKYRDISISEIKAIVSGVIIYTNVITLMLRELK